jgi:hypothetical protein
MPLAANRPVAGSNLRLPPAVVQGQAVKVISRGPGFQVSNDGVALSTAGNGQGAQVRLATGQVVRGIARNGGVVEITLPTCRLPEVPDWVKVSISRVVNPSDMWMKGLCRENRKLSQGDRRPPSSDGRTRAAKDSPKAESQR